MQRDISLSDGQNRQGKYREESSRSPDDDRSSGTYASEPNPTTSVGFHFDSGGFSSERKDRPIEFTYTYTKQI